jgi:hypothetical protein
MSPSLAANGLGRAMRAPERPLRTLGRTLFDRPPRVRRRAPGDVLPRRRIAWGTMAEEGTGRVYKIRVGTLNVVANPHEESDVYLKLFKSARRMVGTIRGTRRGIISHVRVDHFDTDLLRGEFSTFTEIDLEAPWLDLLQGAPVSEEDEAKISIPGHVRPNLRTFPFMFTQRRHRLVFDLRAGSASGVAQMLQQQLQSAAKEEHRVHVRPVHGRVDLAEIFGMESISRLKIVLRPMNLPDDLSEYSAEVAARISDQNVDEQTIILKSETGIVPDAKTMATAQVAAAEDGEVEAHGKVDGAAKTLSTKQRPTEKVLFQEASDRASAVWGALKQAVEAARGRK